MVVASESIGGGLRVELALVRSHGVLGSAGESARGATRNET